MNAKTDRVKDCYAPMAQKSLRSALVHLLGQQFPRALGGERLRGLCAQMILEVVERHLLPREHLRHGQVLWIGIDQEDLPARGKGIPQTRLLPVVLDLSTSEDLQRRIDRVPGSERLLQKALRLCHQSYEQGALLSNCDLAELLAADEAYLGRLLAAYERSQGNVVPRRGTLHDLGRALTHKRIICCKRYAEGKNSEQIARETYHSIEAVDRYLGQFDRVRHCRKEHMSAQETAYILCCGLSVVQEYLAIDRELEGENA